MANVLPCPNRDDLQRFLLGQLLETDTERLNRHLAECTHCLDTLHGLEARDTLIDAMRAQSKPAPGSEDAVVEDLMAHLSDLQPPVANSAIETTIEKLPPLPQKVSLADCRFLSPAEAPDELGRLGGYRVLKILGGGDMGVVLEAEDPRLKRRVALKVMKPELATDDVARKRFLREAQAVAALQHDHIVAIHEVDEDRGVPFLAMPLLRGETLEDRLQREGRLPLAETLRIGREIAEGLAAAHAAGLTHRDVKPANVWLERKDEGGRMKDEKGRQVDSSFSLHPSALRVKIVDFGLARPAVDDLHLTASGMIAGTPSYMSPEQAEGKAVDQRSDLFSLGAVLYRMATGALPFPGASTIAVLRAVALDQPAAPRTLNAELPADAADLILRLLAKDPAQRPAGARQVADVLANMGRAHAARLAAVRPSPKRRSAALLAAAALLVVSLGTLGYFGPAVVYRFATNQGQLVIESHDKDVEVTVKQNGQRVEIVDTQTGHQVTLTPGAYDLEITRGEDGLSLKTNQFTLTRGDTKIVEVVFDPAVAKAKAAAKAAPNVAQPAQTTVVQKPPPPPATPFVILARDGKAETKHVGLAEAVTAARSGDIIEIRGNGPYDCPPLLVKDKALVVRAAGGMQPVLQFGSGELGALGESLQTNAPLTLEGLELRRSVSEEGPHGRKFFLFSSRSRVHITHCRLIVTGKARLVALGALESSVCEVRHCLFAGQLQNTVSFSATKPGGLLIDNCVLASQHGVVFPDGSGSTLRLTRNTFVGHAPVSLFPLAVKEGEKHPAGVPRPVRVESLGNMIDSAAAMTLHVAEEQAPDPQDLVRKAVSWHDQRNVYRPAVQWLSVQIPNRPAEPLPNLKDAKDWQQFWATQGAGPTQGPIQFEGGDVRGKNAATPELLTATEFRLHAKTAGKGAGENGRDLGADVDKVGPGKAYEAWKKSPDYEPWLAATGQSSPFVVLTPGVKAERKFSSLSEAVTASKSGDVVEIRGNGPFETPTIYTGNRALVIRAGKGFEPLLTIDATSLAANAPLIQANGPLVLEGLHFRHVEETTRPGGYTLIGTWAAPFSASHCRFLLRGRGRQLNGIAIGRAPRAEVRHCEFAGEFTIGINWAGLAAFHRLDVSDCLNWGASALVVSFHTPPEVPREIAMRLERNTSVGGVAVQHYYAKLEAPESPDQRPFHFEARDNIFDTTVVLGMTVPAPVTFQPDVDRQLLPRCFTWKESKNVYTGSMLHFIHNAPPKYTNLPVIKQFDEWRGYWGLAADAGSVQGRLRYQGENVRATRVATPEKLTPADFRLHRDSDGKGTGAGGRDLGADVDKVGPGKAYEAWKASPAYTRWLDVTGQVLDPEPFVVMDLGRKKEYRYDTLKKAVDFAHSGDVIEIRGNGPFVTPTLKITDQRSLVLRAGAGFEPVLQIDAKSLDANRPLITTNGPLVLEGLHFRHVETAPTKEPYYHFIVFQGSPAAVTHCRFFIKSSRNLSALYLERSPRVRVRHCEFAGVFNGAVTWNVPEAGELEATDCLCWGAGGFVFCAQNGSLVPRDIAVRVYRNTFLGHRAVLQHYHQRPEPPANPDVKTYRIDARENVFDADGVHMFVHTGTDKFEPEFVRPLLPQVVAWNESKNLFRDAHPLWIGQHGGKLVEIAKSLKEWQEFWRLPETGTLYDRPLYQGGDMRTKKATNPEWYTAGDFRLHAESAGKGAGENGRDLGAAVELVGPGPAYEYWKRSPQYQEWLKTTGQRP